MSNSHTILLPIKPKYCEKILQGTKKYEYRKKLANKKISKIVIYATSPVKMVVGEVDVVSYITEKKNVLWSKTKEFSGVTQAEYNSYFLNSDYASCYVLGKVLPYENPKKLSEFGINYYPQSFVYL